MGRGSILSARVDQDLREYVAAIAAALESGPLDRSQLWDAVDGGTWDAGQFGRALNEAAVKRVLVPTVDNKFVLSALDFASRSGSVPFVQGAEDSSRTVR